jgi:hypothetical protein
MAEDTTAFVIPLHHAPLRKKKDRTGAKRTKAYGQGKKQVAKAKVIVPAETEPSASESLIPPEFLPVDSSIAEPSVTEPPPVTPHDPATQPAVTIHPAITSSRLNVAALTTAALALGAVGITINGWFARSLGASDMAGWLFLAVGVAADLIALVMPSCSAGLWQAGQRATALVGWALWLVTFVFAVTAGLGFASTNIIDVTLGRASRVTPAVTTAQSALSDAMAARDRECRGGVGKFCREREAVVAERRQILDSAMASVGQAADPQADAAIRLITWSSRGALRPAPEDFAMVRLILLALLPQIGGILMMVGRSARVINADEPVMAANSEASTAC